MPHLAWSMSAFSICRQNLPPSPSTMHAYDTPWNHNAFRNVHNLPFFRPALICKQVSTVGQLLEDDALLASLAST